jgi:hypothetical protein
VARHFNRRPGLLFAARAMIILWTNLVVLPAAIAFDAIEVELKRRGAAPNR